MAAQGDDWRRLGEHVLRRREELGLTQPDVHAAGGPSTALMRQIERATNTNYRGSTLRALERVLGWQSGTVEIILAGGDPIPAHGAATGDSQFDALIAWLTRVANNPNREPHIRAIARAQIEQAIALRDADQAEGRARGEAV